MAIDTPWAPVDPLEVIALPECEVDGGLPLGDYRPCRAAFEDRFVNDPTSASRKDIYNGWNVHRDDLRRAGCRGDSECLLNGSFTTTKQDPGDLDLVVGFHVDPATTPNSAVQPILALLQGPDMKARYKCDAYPLMLLPESHPAHTNVTRKGIAYWLRWFGRDRDGREKGRVWARLAGMR